MRPNIKTWQYVIKVEGIESEAIVTLPIDALAQDPAAVDKALVEGGGMQDMLDAMVREYHPDQPVPCTWRILSSKLVDASTEPKLDLGA